MYLKTQTFLVFGLSRSGLASARLLLSHGAKVFLYDEKPSAVTDRNTTYLKSLGGVEITSETLPSIREKCDILVVSPAVPIDHPLPVYFKKNGKKIIGEMELGALFCPATAVAVTGTNGKTTTVGLLKEVLQKTGKTTVACGNVGNPLCNFVEELKIDDIAVVEVSSFQLETLYSLKPHVAVVLNISEDHLNRHYKMENYVFLKRKLLKNSQESEYVVLNYDDEIVKGFAQNTRAKVVWFSLNSRVEGAYLDGDSLCFNNEKITTMEEIPIKGKHNVSNALAAVCVGKIMGLTTQKIAEGLTSFKGVAHRIEKVATIDGVTYINDSKATNVDATVKALEAVTGEIVLLLGGKDKGYDYNALFEKINKSKVVHTILYGENRLKLLSSAIKAGYAQTLVCPQFDMAVTVASIIAKPNQTVLLSPASASFDAFSGYEERGERFVEMVKRLQKEEQTIVAGGVARERDDRFDEELENEREE